MNIYTAVFVSRTAQKHEIISEINRRSLTYLVDNSSHFKCLENGISGPQQKFWLRQNEDWLKTKSVMR